jgi:1-acyl-sn-glycerol-3-phosphate acyltransferase
VSTARRPSSFQRWFGRLVTRRRLRVTEHGRDNVPTAGPAVLAAAHAEPGDGRLLELFGPRPVHVISEPQSVRTALQVLAADQALAILLEGSPGVVERDRFNRRAAYLALVSGAPVVPVSVLRGRAVEGGIDIVYGAPYRTTRQSWPRTPRQVDATSLDLSVHVLVARDAAHTLTERLAHEPAQRPDGGTR